MASWDSTIFNHQRVWDSRGIQRDFIISSDTAGSQVITSRAGNDIQGGQKPWVDEGFGLSSLSFGQSCRLEKSLWIMRWAETFPRLVSAWNVQNWLVVWNMNFIFPIGNFIIPFDELIFFRGVGQPATRKWLEHATVSWVVDRQPVAMVSSCQKSGKIRRCWIWLFYLSKYIAGGQLTIVSVEIYIS